MATKGDPETGRAIPFWKREALWFTAAISLAGLLFVAIIMALVQLLRFGEDAEFVPSVDELYKLSLIGAALVTFCTVVWRGLLSERQVETQRAQVAAQTKQLDKLGEQIAATEENNLASLLQKGAELIAEDKAPAKVSAGIATLHAVAAAENGKFAVPAMDLLAAFVEKHWKEDDQILKAALQDLKDVFETKKRRSIRAIYLTSAPIKKDKYTLQVYGVSSVVYSRGNFHGNAIDDDKSEIMSQYKGVLFQSCTITEGTKRQKPFEQCRFDYCPIKKVSIASLRANEFNNCDLSGCIILGSSMDGVKISGIGNFFLADNPPVCPDNPTIDWSLYFEARPAGGAGAK